jgi:AhpD family alkylhydroperoxidase
MERGTTRLRRVPVHAGSGRWHTPGNRKKGEGPRIPENPMELLGKEAPEVAGAFGGLIRSLEARKGLDPKAKQLVYIALQAAAGEAGAVRAHLPMARRAGATREEVVDAILVTLPVAGIRGIVTCLPDVVRYFEECTLPRQGTKRRHGGR